MNKCLNRNTYKGLIKILSYPVFLLGCYEAIRGKPGNMSKGISSTTLYGLKGTLFTKVAEDLKSGKFNFKPLRRVLIPKSGKTEKRPLGVGSPRDKVIQKALQVVIEAIWEKEFLPSSFGFRANKSIHQLLHQLHLKGSTFQ